MRARLALLFFFFLAANGIGPALFVQSTDDTYTVDGLGLWLALCHGIGGAVGGWLLAGLFGQPGFIGWVASFFASIFVVSIAAVAGGLLVAVQGMITAGDDLLVAAIRGGTAALSLPVSMFNVPGLWLTLPVMFIAGHQVGRRNNVA